MGREPILENLTRSSATQPGLNRTREILVLGAGFGGTTFCRHFEHPQAHLTLVDRTNHHLFQPLLYQVATAGLSAPDIAQPIRSIFSKRADVTVLMGEVADLDLAGKRVALGAKDLHYDYLVLALGGVTSYFGHPEWERFAPGLKTLEDALLIRNRILLAFENAETASDKSEQTRLMTIIVIGGGPTGVELAGALAELARVVLRKDFRRIDPAQARVILIEGTDRLLSHLPPDLSEKARRQLEKLGVAVRTAAKVRTISEGCVELESGERLCAENIIWAAGVAAQPLTEKLGVERDRAGRVKVEPDLSLPGHPEVFAIGDMAVVLQENGRPVPGVSPAAMQMAKYVARVIGRELAGTAPKAARAEPFRYWDKGTMATIGRSAAVAIIGKLRLSGMFAWLAWLFVHLLFLIGFRNRFSVLMNWIYSYFTWRRGARIIIARDIRETGSTR